MAVVDDNVRQPLRLGAVEGFQGRKNEIILHLPADCLTVIGTIIYFGGDMQDFKENMLAHRDNKYYSDWDLESTATILNCHFPDHVILVIKPAKMALKTFSCFENFVTTNNFGAPTYSLDSNSVQHLKILLQNIAGSKNNSNIHSYHLHEKPLTLIGFSKGCVVLNQFLYSFHYLKNTPNEELETFLNKIHSMYWIDGGHSGTSPTWITDKAILETFSKLKIKTYVHVTPYQVLCDTRPRIGKEEKVFSETLRKLGVEIRRKLHFDFDTRSLDNHFKVLRCFHEKD